MNATALREKLTEIKAALTRPPERPEIAELLRTEAELREAELAERAVEARELARRAAAFGPELERARAATLKAIHGFAEAFDAERAARERALAAGLTDPGPWSVGPAAATTLLRIAAEDRENNR